jgi:hypothetical protein
VDPAGPGALELQTSEESVCSGRLAPVHENPIDVPTHPVTVVSGPHVFALNVTSTQQ